MANKQDQGAVPVRELRDSYRVRVDLLDTGSIRPPEPMQVAARQLLGRLEQLDDGALVSIDMDQSDPGSTAFRLVESGEILAVLPTEAAWVEAQDAVESRGLLLGLSLIGVLAVLLVSAMVAPDSASGEVLLGLYLIAWGLMFLAAYFFSAKTFFFRGLMWVCVNFSIPRGRAMAFLYAIAFITVGTMAVATSSSAELFGS